jgi:hypothetical protein
LSPLPFISLTGLSTGETVPMFSESSRDVGKQFVLHAAASNVICSLETRGELYSGIG